MFSIKGKSFASFLYKKNTLSTLRYRAFLAIEYRNGCYTFFLSAIYLCRYLFFLCLKQ